MARCSRRELVGLSAVALLNNEDSTIAQANAEQTSVELMIDFGHKLNAFRALHGINKGAIGSGGLVSVEAEHRALGVPFVRLHDCHYPNPDVVDIHAVFPNLAADPADPKSYDFALTDEYLASIRATGAQIIYRLGESIEHTPHKRYVHPPKSPEKWAQIALGIIRHYNEGWANGFRHDIRYWEIWNEPENRPVMWSGTDADYFQLYKVTAQAIKAQYPNLKVGGPAVGYTGQIVGGKFTPSKFVEDFLAYCRTEKLPLDFFSWHGYTADLLDLPLRAVAIRKMLDAAGFTKTESHLNEWNYLPDNGWEGLARTTPAKVRQKFVDRMTGMEGGAFLVATLLALQDTPLDVCNLFHGELGAFGLFNEQGIPFPNYHALLVFRELLDTPLRVHTSGFRPDKELASVGISADNSFAQILISNVYAKESLYRLTLKSLPWRTQTRYEIEMIDSAQPEGKPKQQGTLKQKESLEIALKSPAVALIKLRPVE